MLVICYLFLLKQFLSLLVGGGGGQERQMTKRGGLGQGEVGGMCAGVGEGRVKHASHML